MVKWLAGGTKMRWMAVALLAACGGDAATDAEDLVGQWTLTATRSGTIYALVMAQDLRCEQIAMQTLSGRACADYSDKTLTPLKDLCLDSGCTARMLAGLHFEPGAGFFAGDILRDGERVAAKLKKTTR